MRFTLCSAVALLAVAGLSGCNRVPCEDRGDTAIQMALPHLTPDVVGKLVAEASLCITNALADSPVPPSYVPTTDEAPVAYSLRAEPPSQFSMGMGATVAVRTVGISAPYMAVRLPVHAGAGLCLWGLYVCVKPGGGFARDNPTWVAAEGSTKPAPVVRLNDEVILYAELRSNP
ncbi:MAG TPA: hypothetical protein VMP11_05955 [Verrucomicrobiae bacterium]|nr:hypothetical protein [Verrucomicrobiae bacterium]